MTRTPASPPSLPVRWRAAVLCMAGALAACNKPQPPAAPDALAGGPPPVTVAAAIEREVLETDEFPGRFEATESVQVRPRITGYIKALHFRPGSEVKAGDLLAEIDPAPFEARLAEAEAAAGNTQAQLKLARLELARQKKMLPEKATSRRDYETAAASVAALEAAARTDQARIEVARVDLGYTRITAPISGRVGKDELTVGNLVRGEVDAPLLTTLVAIDPIYATFEADEAAYLKYISAARSQRLQVSVGLANEEGAPHAATLSFIDNQLDMASGSVRLRATLANPDRRFTPGLFARVRLAAGIGKRRVVMVTDAAVGTDQSKRYVLVLGPKNEAQYREVTLGRAYDGLRVVETGLNAGEQVVINGLQRVRPGTPVTPEVVDMPVPPTLARAAPAAQAAPSPASAPPAPAAEAGPLPANPEAPPPGPVVAPEVAAEIPTPTPAVAPGVAAEIPRPTQPTPAPEMPPPAKTPAVAPAYSFDWLMQQPRSSWVVQLVASTDRRDVEVFLKRHGLRDTSAVFTVKREGRTWYHAVSGLYPSMRSAQAAVDALPAALRAATQPWPRSLRTLATLDR